MACLRLLLLTLFALHAASSQFIPPDIILQAGYPTGFRAFIPDYPGMEMFSFHAKVNNPFLNDELGTFAQDILRPQDGFWTFQDLNVVLTPGDIIHYWATIVKDGVDYLKRNQTWKVPEPDETVDLLSPITLKPPRSTGVPEKMRETEETTTAEEQTTPSPTSEESSSTNTPDQTESSPTTASQTTPSTTTTTTTTTTKKPTTTTKKPPTTTEKPKPTKPKKSPQTPTPAMAEEVEELTTPFSLDKPLGGEFPGGEPSEFFPFPSLFPRPPKPLMPSSGPGFEICSNPWNFEEQLGETRTQRLERQVAKLQCQLAMFQRGYNQLGNTVENELTDLKKLIYGMVSRMQRLESIMRTAAFG